MKSQGPKYKRSKWRKGSQHGTGRCSSLCGNTELQSALQNPALPAHPAWPSSSRSQDGSSTCKHFTCICPGRGKAQVHSTGVCLLLETKSFPRNPTLSLLCAALWPELALTKTGQCTSLVDPLSPGTKLRLTDEKGREKMDVDEQVAVSFSRIVSLCKKYLNSN